MNILNNAVNAINLATEDYQMKDLRRINSCVRNLYAGVLLLFKEKLSRMSPDDSDDVFLKSKVIPKLDNSGAIIWKGKGKNTVNVQQITDHFKNLDIHVDWKRMNAIKNYRNNIEHYFSEESHESIRTYICDCFILITDFIREHLENDPLTLLGQESWGVFVKEKELYDKVKKECLDNLRKMDCDNEILTTVLEECTCSECGSDFIDLKDPTKPIGFLDFFCRACGERWGFEDIVEIAMQDYYGTEDYISATQGGVPATIECPSCSRSTYHIEKNICFLCEYEAKTECPRCFGEILPEEMTTEEYCGSCESRLGKDEDRL